MALAGMTPNCALLHCEKFARHGEALDLCVLHAQALNRLPTKASVVCHVLSLIKCLISYLLLKMLL